jgi:hypothetical protein
MYFPTYCTKTIAVAVTFIATFIAVSALAVLLLKTTTLLLLLLLLLLFPIAPSVSAQQQEDEGVSGEQQQEENDIDLADLSTTMTGEQTMTNETAAIDQQTVSTEISGLTTADFETTRENLVAVRQGLLDNDTAAALNALNSADNSLFAVILDQKGSQGNGQMMTTTTTNEQLKSLQTQIDSARDVLRNGNYVKSLEALNTADSQLFNMTQSLEAQDIGD